MDSPPQPELFDFHGVSMTHYFTPNWENVQNFQATPDDILIATYPKADHLHSLQRKGQCDVLNFDHMTTFEPEPGDWNSYLQRFVEGKHNWENVQNFQARPDDILIATYPKAGTTWVSYILDLLYFGQMSPERQTTIPIFHRVPLLEIAPPSMETGKDRVDKLPTSPRLIKTHFPVQFVPKSFWKQNCRMIYVARNAKDNVVSSFHFDHMNMVQPHPGDWSSYLQRFMQGKILLGSWYDHVNGWWKKKQAYSKLHYMFYEDMIEDTGREIDKLCSFLGLSPSAEEKKKIVAGVQFDNMKKNDMTNFSTSPFMDVKICPFIRKGKVGDWKNHFTVAQNEEFDEDYKKKMNDPTLQFRTEI